MVLKTVCIISFIDVFNVGLLIPLLHKHILHIGGTHLINGILGTVTAFLLFISGPIIGSLSDTRGRNYVLKAVFFFALASNFLLGFSSSLIFFIISRVLAGVAGKSQILLKTILSDNISNDQQPAAFGKLGAISAIGFLVGPIFGGYLYQQTHDFSIIYLILSASTILCIALIYFLPTTTSTKKTENVNVGQEILNSFTKLAKVNWKLFWDIFAMKFLLELAYSQFYGTFGIVMAEVFLLNQIQMGYVISFYAFLFILSNLSLAKLNKILPQQKEHKNFVTVAVLTSALLGSFMSSNKYTYMLMFVPLAFTKSLFDATFLAMLTERVTDSEKGITMGSYESTMSLAGLSTPLIMGAVNEYYGYSVGRAICLFPASLATILSFYFTKKPVFKLRKD